MQGIAPALYPSYKATMPVLQFPKTTPDLSPPETILTLARRLSIMSILSPDALALAGHVWARVKTQGSRQVAIMPSEVADRAVTGPEGQIAVGLGPNNLLAVNLALQELQFKMGILNHYHAVSLDAPDANQRHFTLNPITRSGVNWTMSTPIIFRLPELSAHDWLMAIDQMIERYFQDHSRQEPYIA